MRKTIVVPAELVSDVRVGLHSLIGGAAQELDRIVDLSDRERYPEWYIEPRAKMTRVWVLLDAIGWRETNEPTAVKLDVVEHRRALGEAINLMMGQLAVELHEAELARKERDEHREERLAKLWSLALRAAEET